jgi:hypothetical protein
MLDCESAMKIDCAWQNQRYGSLEKINLTPPVLRSGGITPGKQGTQSEVMV